jgi:hypothetical protein
MSLTDELYRSRRRTEEPGRSARSRARGVTEPAVETAPDVVEPDDHYERPIVRLARAWKRVMLGADGKLHADGKLILQDLFKRSRFFGVGQYSLNNQYRTLELAVTRQLVTHILGCVGLSEMAIGGDPDRALNLREDVFKDDD